MAGESTDREERAAYWLQLADYDLKSAEVMFKGRMYLYVGFMCHQVIEKALKACIVKRKLVNPPISHNLLMLSQDARIHDEMNDRQRALLGVLRPLNIECRYPTYREKLLKDLSPKRCREILSQTKDLYKWLKKQS